MSILVYMLVWLAGSLVVAAVSGTGRGTRGAPLVGSLLLPLPYLVEGHPLIRLLLASATVWVVIRAAELRDEGFRRSFMRRWLHLVSLIDTRLVSRGPVRVDLSATIRVVIAIGLLISLAAVSAPALRWPVLPGRLVLWIAAGVAVFCALELAAGTLELLAAAFGRAIPAVNNAPYRARTVSEFWSRRWNLVMTRILQERCFKPLVRWNVGLAWFSCFVLSAAIHAYAMGAALGAVPAISWGAFFLIQPVVIIVERRLGVRRWAWYAGRLWTMVMLLLTLPLFAEPVLRLALSPW